MSKPNKANVVPFERTFYGTGTLRSALLDYSKDRMKRDPRYAHRVIEALKARKRARKAEAEAVA